MNAEVTSAPFYLATTPDPVFAWSHTPDPGVRRGTGVVVCAPWGWEEVASYRSRRTWAHDLAAAGHPVLRFDAPGAGDSGGRDSDPGRVDAWLGAITAAAAWLRGPGGCSRVCALGLGLGGLLAGIAAGRDAPIDDLVLWAAPARGRAFRRREVAFAALQSSRYTLTGEPLDNTLPDGWLESGGFVLSPETLDAVGRLDLREGAPGVSRALVLDQDGLAPDGGLVPGLEAAGAAVTAAPGPGWGELIGHPERSRPPLAVMATLRAWLADAPATPSSRPAPAAPATSPDVRLDIGGTAVRERPLALAHGGFGILSEPADAADDASDLLAVFLNAGAWRRIGPNRLWTEAARASASEGVPALRLDVEGLGDADGDAAPYAEVGHFYRDEVGELIRAATDGRPQQRHLLVGLCAGGYWGFQLAADEPRVDTALMLNAGALTWDPELESQRLVRKLRRLRSRVWWRRILRGDVQLARMREVIAALVRTTAARLRLAAPPDEAASSAPDEIDRVADRALSRGARLVIAFSEDEPLRDELVENGQLARLGAKDGVVLCDLPARDHTLRPIVAQRAALELVAAEVRRAAVRTSA